MNPKVSIITVCYNAEKFIESAIQSVISQSYSNIEYIVVDGNSKDNTLTIIEKYKTQISHIISEPDKGIYDAMNKGVEKASGEFIGILNADDFYKDENVIEKIVSVYLNEKVDAVYADLVYVEQENTDKIIRKWVSGKYIDNSFKKGWMPPHPTFFLTKKTYQTYGNYSLVLKSAADYELMLRMVHKHKIKIAYLPETIVKMRVGGVSNASFKNRVKANREDKKAWEMNDLKPGLFTFIKKPLRKINQYWKK